MLRALLVVAGLASAGKPAAPIAWAEQPADETLQEVVASLNASSAARASLDRYALAGLDALAEQEPCLARKVQGAALVLSCRDESTTTAWPPATARDVATLLSTAIRLVDPKHALQYARVKVVARACANAVGDPYTGYLPPELVAKGTSSSYAVNGTVGVEVEPRDPTRVRAVAPLSDAEQEGIVEGDRIVAVDGVPAKKLTYTEMSFQLVGPVDSVVRLVVEDARGARRDVRVTRQAVQDSEPFTRELDGGALYVRIPAWTPGVARRVAASLWENRAAGVVVDLRHNGGGRMEEAVALADLFLGAGRIAGVRTGAGRPAQDWTAKKDSTDLTSPLVVLVDGGSGSASELFAMVLQERGRAVLLGAQSLGKGSVQELIKLPDGGFLKVTIGSYVGPSGRRLDEKGVRPDRWLAKPARRTVLQGAQPEEDEWVDAAIDALRGQTVADRGNARVYGPTP